MTANGKSLDIPITGTAITTIMGNVTDLSSGNKLAGATVAITGGANTQTDPSGNFIFDPPPANGTYTVTISKSGYSSATYNNVIVTDTKGTNLNVGLAPAGTFNVITPDGPLAHAETSIPYSQRIAITGGVWPYTFSLDSGTTLPPGLTLDSALGTISGTPSQAGSYSFDIVVTDGKGMQAWGSYTIEITAPLVITTADNLPRGTRTVSYTQSMSASGGAKPYTFTRTSGLLPNSLNLSSAGVITGTPSAAGTFTFVVQVQDASGRTASKSYTINIVDPLLQTTGALPDGLSGNPYTTTLTAFGGYGPHTWGIYSGTLPVGLSLDSAGGVVSGIPAEATSQIVVISVHDAEGRIAYKTYTFNVYDPLQVSTTTLPNGLVNDPYSEMVRRTGGKPPFSFSSDVALPTGLSLNPTTGEIYGTPSAKGGRNFVVTVKDSFSPTPQTVTQPLTLRIVDVLTITSGAILPPAQKGVVISPLILTAKGGPSPFTWSLVSGYLPEGITLNAATGAISGTPKDRGDFVFTIRCTDNNKATADKQFFLHISETLVITTTVVPDGAKDTPYSAQLTATGGVKPYTWSIKTGTLPTGLTIDSKTGTIYGTPNARITSSFTVQVADSDAPAQTATKDYIVDVKDTLTIYEQSLPNARLNQAYTASVHAQLGVPPYTWRVASGTLPLGAELKQNAGVATIEGTVTAAGPYNFTLEVSDTGAPVQTVSRAYSVTVYPDVTITTASLRTAIRGTSYKDSIVATGGAAPITYRIVAGTLPLGLVFNSATGDITGSVIMDAGQSAVITVRATDSGSPSASVERQFTILAVDPLAITTGAIQGAVQKALYSAPFTGQGGFSPLAWSKVGGNLPASMVLDPSTGILSGTTPVCGTFDFTLQLADSSPIPLTLQKAYQLTVVCCNDYDLAGSVGVTGVTVALSTGSTTQTVTSGTGGSYLFQHLTNGNYTVTPTRTGYWFTSESKSITINNLDMPGVNFIATADSSPPTGGIAINGGAKYTRLTSASLGLSAKDVGSGVVTKMQFSTDGGPWTTPENFAATKPWTLTTGDGAKTIAVKYLDKAGNWSDAISATITMDTTNPDTTIVTKPAALSTTRAPSFSFTSTDPDSTFECQLDSGAFALCPTPKVYSGLIDGSHAINVRAIDGAGNVDPSQATYAWTIDATPPQVSITGKPVNPTKLQTATFAFGTADTTAVLECALDAGSFASCSSPVIYNNLTEGSHTFQVRATDPATNSAVLGYTWAVDLTPPDTTITDKPAVITTGTTANFSFTTTEAGATFDCQLDSSGYAPCTSPKNYAALALTSHTFAVRATDTAGNPDPTPATYTWDQGVNLKVTYADVGGGNVTSIPGSKLTCTGTCTEPFSAGSKISLQATPDIYSYFAGWSGSGCTGIAACPLTLNADTGVTATFSVMAPLRIPAASPVYYQKLRDAYTAAPVGQPVIIQGRIVELAESFKLNRAIPCTLEGGYDSDYSQISGATTIRGSVTVVKGSMTVKNLIIR